MCVLKPSGTPSENELELFPSFKGMTINDWGRGNHPPPQKKKKKSDGLIMGKNCPLVTMALSILLKEIILIHFQKLPCLADD